QSAKWLLKWMFLPLSLLPLYRLHWLSVGALIRPPPALIRRGLLLMPLALIRQGLFKCLAPDWALCLILTHPHHARVCPPLRCVCPLLRCVCLLLRCACPAAAVVAAAAVVVLATVVALAVL